MCSDIQIQSTQINTHERVHAQAKIDTNRLHADRNIQTDAETRSNADVNIQFIQREHMNIDGANLQTATSQSRRSESTPPHISISTRIHTCSHKLNSYTYVHMYIYIRSWSNMLTISQARNYRRWEWRTNEQESERIINDEREITQERLRGAGLGQAESCM